MMIEMIIVPPRDLHVDCRSLRGPRHSGGIYVESLMCLLEVKTIEIFRGRQGSIRSILLCYQQYFSWLEFCFSLITCLRSWHYYVRCCGFDCLFVLYFSFTMFWEALGLYEMLIFFGTKGLH
uniref:Uncharacterized protein n=1 Tax=Setaria italica TaxID=4555 RepID=K3ZAT5_SETIT